MKIVSKKQVRKVLVLILVISILLGSFSIGIQAQGLAQGKKSSISRAKKRRGALRKKAEKIERVKEAEKKEKESEAAEKKAETKKVKKKSKRVKNQRARKKKISNENVSLEKQGKNSDDNESSKEELEIIKEEKNIQRIPLHAGWNLISFSVNKCFYVDEKPTANMIQGIEYQKVESIDQILSSLKGQYSYVRGMDESGAKTYNKSIFSDMKYMAAGYGYQIKINEDADFDENGLVYLEVEGEMVSGDMSIQLHEGWNLVGHLGNKVKYLGEKPQVHFPENVDFVDLDPGKDNWDADSVAEMRTIFATIDGQFSYVGGMDEAGAKTFNLTVFSDLHYVGPGYGYWIKVDKGKRAFLSWELILITH